MLRALYDCYGSAALVDGPVATACCTPIVISSRQEPEPSSKFRWTGRCMNVNVHGTIAVDNERKSWMDFAGQIDRG